MCIKKNWMCFEIEKEHHSHFKALLTIKLLLCTWNNKKWINYSLNLLARYRSNWSRSSASSSNFYSFNTHSKSAREFSQVSKSCRNFNNVQKLQVFQYLSVLHLEHSFTNFFKNKQQWWWSLGEIWSSPSRTGGGV